MVSYLMYYGVLLALWCSTWWNRDLAIYIYDGTEYFPVVIVIQ